MNGRAIITGSDLRRLRALRIGGEFERELESATIVPADAVPDDVVTMYSRVRYLDETTGERREAMLVYPDEAAPLRNRISVLGPVGSALLGRRNGQSVDCPLPGGASHRLRVLKLLYQPESGAKYEDPPPDAA